MLVLRLFVVVDFNHIINAQNGHSSFCRKTQRLNLRDRRLHDSSDHIVAHLAGS